MDIRRIKSSDAEGFATLWGEVYQEGLFLRSGPPPIDVISQVLTKVQNTKIPQFVALNGMQVIGSIEAFPGSMCGQELDSVGFLGAQVSKDCRRKGVGRALLDTVIQDSKRYGFEELRLTVFQSNLAAQKLYRSFGFEFRGETNEVLASGEEEPAYRMNLLLV